MAIKMVREPSATPNITNIDDFVGLRYAYGDQNGYCLNKGRELDHRVSGSNFTILSGRLVIQGVECDIDANGVSITVDSVSGVRYHTVYAEISLATMSVSVKALVSTLDYPQVEAGDNLTENTAGVARLPLYHLQSNSGVVSTVTKVVNPIKNTLAKTMTTVQIPARGAYDRFTLPLKAGSMYLWNVIIEEEPEVQASFSGYHTCFLTTPPEGSTQHFFSTPIYNSSGNYMTLIIFSGFLSSAGEYTFEIRYLNHYVSESKPGYLTTPVTIQYCEI